jgi:hypothetical protein
MWYNNKMWYSKKRDQLLSELYELFYCIDQCDPRNKVSELCLQIELTSSYTVAYELNYFIDQCDPRNKVSELCLQIELTSSYTVTLKIVLFYRSMGSRN